MSIFSFVILLFAGVANAGSSAGGKGPGSGLTTHDTQMGLWDSIMASMSPPEDISTNGHLIDWLFNYTTYMNMFFFALVCVGLFGFTYKYHHRRNPKPYYTYGNKKIHLIVVLVIGTAVFMGIDMNITRISNNDFINTFINFPDPKKEDVVRVQVLAQQWAWNFRYPGKDGLFNTDDDIVTLNDLRIPEGKKVLAHITSKDVIHSLYLPNVRLKVDALPGRITRMWFDTNKPGVYDIACAEMCGTHHYLMAAKMTVYSQEDYLAWRDEARQIALTANDVENPDSFWGWKWEN